MHLPTHNAPFPVSSVNIRCNLCLLFNLLQRSGRVLFTWYAHNAILNSILSIYANQWITANAIPYACWWRPLIRESMHFIFNAFTYARTATHFDAITSSDYWVHLSTSVHCFSNAIWYAQICLNFMTTKCNIQPNHVRLNLHSAPLNAWNSLSLCTHVVLRHTVLGRVQWNINWISSIWETYGFVNHLHLNLSAIASHLNDIRNENNFLNSNYSSSISLVANYGKSERIENEQKSWQMLQVIFRLVIWYCNLPYATA